MKKIYIISSEKDKKEVQLLENAEIIDKISGDIDITAAIKKLLDKNHLDISDVTEIESYLGPGSFTGLKIGITVANVLNWALGKIKASEFKVPQYGSEPNIQK